MAENTQDLFRNADILMDSLREYCRETEERQREERRRRREEREQQGAHSQPMDMEIYLANAVAAEPDDTAIIDSMPSTSRASRLSNSSLDNKVVIDGVAVQLDGIEAIGQNQDKDMIEQLTAETLQLSEQIRFIEEKSSGYFVIEDRKRAAIISNLKHFGYPADPVKQFQNEKAHGEQEMTEESNFDYLIGLSLWTFTVEGKDDLLKQFDEKFSKLTKLKNH